MIGLAFTAPWGRYRVHSELADQVVLRDVDRSSAFVVVTREKLAREYAAGAGAAIDQPGSGATTQEATVTPLVPARPSITSWAPPPRLAGFYTYTLGAPIPERENGVQVGEPYWMPCIRRDTAGGTHCWFVSEGCEVLCPACRGEERDAKPAYADPPPLEAGPAARLVELGAQRRAMCRPGEWGRVAHNLGHISAGFSMKVDPNPRNPAAFDEPDSANISPDDLEQLDQVVLEHRDLKPENVRRCADCGKRLGVVAFTGDHGLDFCGACVELSDHLREVLARHKGAEQPKPGAWRPRDEESNQGDAKSEIGSFRRTKPEAPPPAARPRTTAELWPTYTAEVER